MEIQLIGEVGVDSGQLLLCDPYYIDSEWKEEEYEDVRIYKHKTTNKRLQYRVDFEHYEQIIPEYGKTMNQLNDTDEWELIQEPHSKENFSYSACCDVTLSEKGHGELFYKRGFPGIGVAFSTQIGDGIFPVYAVYDDDGTLLKVEVVFSEPEN